MFIWKKRKSWDGDDYLLPVFTMEYHETYVDVVYAPYAVRLFMLMLSDVIEAFDAFLIPLDKDNPLAFMPLSDEFRRLIGYYIHSMRIIQDRKDLPYSWDEIELRVFRDMAGDRGSLQGSWTAWRKYFLEALQTKHKQYQDVPYELTVISWQLHQEIALLNQYRNDYQAKMAKVELLYEWNSGKGKLTFSGKTEQFSGARKLLLDLFLMPLGTKIHLKILAGKLKKPENDTIRTLNHLHDRLGELWGNLVSIHHERGEYWLEISRPL